MKTGSLTSRWAVYERMAGLCGVVSPFLGLILIAVSIYYHPSFSWTQNYLSLLGVEGPARALFNASLITSGVLYIVFAIGFGHSIPTRRLLVRLGTLSLVLGACALSAIGIFTRTTGTPHDCASVAFFCLMPVALFLIGAAQLASSKLASGLFTLTCGVLMVVLQLIPWPWGSTAISQLLAGLPLSVWLVVFGARLFMAPNRVKL